MITKINTQVVVIGSGPSGYSAAFRCADLGLDTILVERYPNIGGVCLNVGCIPSKALLHIAKVFNDNKKLIKYGILSNEPKVNFDKLVCWKKNIVNHLTNGLNKLAKARNIKILQGYGKFNDSNSIRIENNNKEDIFFVNFNKAIIAVGSRPIKLSFAPNEDYRIWYSTSALNLNFIPKRLLIVGGGIIGLELATVYSNFGSIIDIVEMNNQIISQIDHDVAKFFIKNINSKFNFILETSISSIESSDNNIRVGIKAKHKSLEYHYYDAVLIAIGRIPNSNLLDIEKSGVEMDEKGFIKVDKQMRTNVPNIFAVGDVIGQPMLAHKGIHEGHIAAQVIYGKKHYFDPRVIPCVAYTSPEIAWSGITEKEAKRKNIEYKTSIFPWKVLGRAISSNYQEGITKLIFNKENHRIIGGEIVGENSSEIINEISLAIEMGCCAEDIALTIHAHPTLSESISLASEIYEGTITDLLNSTLEKY